MKVSQIHAGRYYANSTGQVRRVKDITPSGITIYEVVERGQVRRSDTNTPEKGYIGRVTIGSFAGWARYDVTEKYCADSHVPDPAKVQAAYKRVIGPVREAARNCGYAIGVHGSVKRDIDLIAAPWVDEPAPVDTLVEAIFKAAEGISKGTLNPKPRGRKAVSLYLVEGTYIDLSIMPVT